jgi:hypothetical protein
MIERIDGSTNISGQARSFREEDILALTPVDARGVEYWLAPLSANTRG